MLLKSSVHVRFLKQFMCTSVHSILGELLMSSTYTHWLHAELDVSQPFSKPFVEVEFAILGGILTDHCNVAHWCGKQPTNVTTVGKLSKGLSERQTEESVKRN